MVANCQYHARMDVDLVLVQPVLVSRPRDLNLVVLHGAKFIHAHAEFGEKVGRVLERLHTQRMCQLENPCSYMAQEERSDIWRQ